MLFRAVAPKRVVEETLVKLSRHINPFCIANLAEKVIDPENYPLTVSYNVPSDKFDELMKQTQASPAKIHRPDGQRRSYANDDTLWLSDHDGESAYISESELDLFIAREE